MVGGGAVIMIMIINDNIIYNIIYNIIIIIITTKTSLTSIQSNDSDNLLQPHPYFLFNFVNFLFLFFKPSIDYHS